MNLLRKVFTFCIGLIVVFPSLALSNPSPPSGGLIRMSEEKIDELETVAKQLLSWCPPATCVLVGTGRSPTAVFAYLEATGAASPIQVPLSKFYFSRNHPQSVFRLPSIARLAQEEESRLYEHLGRFLPSAQELGTRSILLTDFAFTTGEQLLGAASYLEGFYQNQAHSPVIKVAPLIHPLQGDSLEEKFRKIIPDQLLHVIRLDPGMHPSDPNLAYSLRYQSFDPYSPYGGYSNFSLVVDPSKKRPEYTQLIEAIRSHRRTPSACLTTALRGISP